MTSALDALLGRLAVRLCAGSDEPRALEAGARRAAALRLAGIYRFGLALDVAGAVGVADAGAAPVDGAALSKSAAEALRRAAAGEAAEDARVERELGVVLDALRPWTPAPLKGRALALSVWPTPAYRPAGDLDLLLDATALPAAAAALTALGYRPAPRDAAGRWRAGPTGIDLMPPSGSRVAVDLHARLFRSIGAGLDGARLLARARAGTLSGRPVRVLDDADRLVYLFVHAAKHAVAEPKWLLDLYAVALRTDEPTWIRAAERAAAGGATRPFAVAAQLVSRLPEVRVPLPLRVGPVAGALLGRLISVERARRGGPLPMWQRYALELLLEESVVRRAGRLLGLLEGRIRRG